MSKLGPDLSPQTVQIKVQNKRKKVNDKRGPIKTKELILSVKRHQYYKILQCLLAFSGDSVVPAVPASNQKSQRLFGSYFVTNNAVEHVVLE